MYDSERARRCKTEASATRCVELPSHTATLRRCEAEASATPIVEALSHAAALSRCEIESSAIHIVEELSHAAAFRKSATSRSFNACNSCSDGSRSLLRARPQPLSA